MVCLTFSMARMLAAGAFCLCHRNGCAKQGTGDPGIFVTSRSLCTLLVRRSPQRGEVVRRAHPCHHHGALGLGVGAPRRVLWRRRLPESNFLGTIRRPDRRFLCPRQTILVVFCRAARPRSALGILADIMENCLAKSVVLPHSRIQRGALRRQRHSSYSCLVTATIVILSAVSGKRPHYLLPMFPALALLVSYLIVMHAQGHFIRGRARCSAVCISIVAASNSVAIRAGDCGVADKSVCGPHDPGLVWPPIFDHTCAALAPATRGDHSPPVHCRNQHGHGLDHSRSPAPR